GVPCAVDGLRQGVEAAEGKIELESDVGVCRRILASELRLGQQQFQQKQLAVELPLVPEIRAGGLLDIALQQDEVPEEQRRAEKQQAKADCPNKSTAAEHAATSIQPGPDAPLLDRDARQLPH